MGQDIVANAEGDELPYVGNILAFQYNKRTQKKEAKVRWYYRPEDTVCEKRQPFHGRMELFMSDHGDLLPLDCIAEPCEVLTLTEYEVSQTCRPPTTNSSVFCFRVIHSLLCRD